MLSTHPTRPRSRVPFPPLAAGLLIAVTALGAASAATTVVAADAPAVFDSSTVHAITVSYDQAAYDAMIAAYKDTGDKEWIEATVTIDGTAFEQVGMRLKGNSSLMGLRGGFGGRGFGGDGNGRVPGPAASGAPAIPSVDATPAAAASPAPDASTTPDTVGVDPIGRGGPGGFNQVAADEPEGLPWLIRLDKNVDGQSIDGVTDIVVRSNNSETSLNEAVALELLSAAGLASQAAAPTSFSINGSDPVLRLIIENPDDAWQAAHFTGDGALYKAESTGDWTYRGDDPEAYADVFDQEAGKDVADLAPLIDFLRFINEADDATFAAELPTRLDVDAFARYLAMMDLLDNFDDIDGPGNNAYLHWDAATGVFTIVPWDMNLAFGGLGGGRRFEGGAGMQPPAGFDPTASFDPSQLPPGFDPSQLPPGFDPSASFDPAQLPGGGQAGPGRPGGFGGPGGFSRSNPLVEKFHANADFEAAYQAQLTSLREQLYASGTGQEIVDRWAAVLTEQATDLVDAATIAEEAEAIAEQLSAP